MSSQRYEAAMFAAGVSCALAALALVLVMIDA